MKIEFEIKDDEELIANVSPESLYIDLYTEKKNGKRKFIRTLFFNKISINGTTHGKTTGEKKLKGGKMKFIDAGDGTVSCPETGLMWVKAPDSKSRTWREALEYANGLTLCGYSDWRLPNAKELESLINAGESNSATWLSGQGFSGVQSGYYWTATACLGGTWFVGMWYGLVCDGRKTDVYYVWPVRDI